MARRARERKRESERWRKESYGTSRKPSDVESDAVDRPQEQGRPSLADGGRNRPAGGIGGARTVVRGWRVKGRDVLGPVDTAESPESEPSSAKIRADEDISSREGA